MPTLATQFQPLVTAFVARGQQMLQDSSLTIEQLTALGQSIGLMYRAMQPTNFTVVDVSAQVDAVAHGFAFMSLAGAPFLITVNAQVLNSSKWRWSVENRTLILEGYTFPAGAVVELYTFWNGDEVAPQPISA